MLESLRGRFSSSYGLLGVDYGSRTVKMLQLREQGDGLHVVGAAEEPLPAGDGAGEVAVAKGTWAQRGATGPGVDDLDSDLPSPVRPCVRGRLHEGPAPPGTRAQKGPTGDDGTEGASEGGPPSGAALASDCDWDSGSRANGPHAFSPLAPSPLSSRLRAAFAAGGFTGRRCVVSLPRSDVHIQAVRLPRMPEDELYEAAAWEASQRFGFDRDAMEVAVLRTGAALQSTEAREEVLLVAMPHHRLEARLQPLLEAGLRPTAVDADFAALARLVSRHLRRDADRQHVRAVVDVGASGATVIILRGDQIAFCKPLTLGGTDLNHAVAEHLQLPAGAAAELRATRINEQERAATAEGRLSRPSAPQSQYDAEVSDRHCSDEKEPAAQNALDPATDRAVFEAVRPLLGDLVKEISMCLRYYGVTFRGHPPRQVILTGGDGLEPALDDMISSACKVPVAYDVESPAGQRTLAALHGQLHTALNRFPGPTACWAVAAGLSIRGIAQRSEPGCSRRGRSPSWFSSGQDRSKPSHAAGARGAAQHSGQPTGAHAHESAAH